MGRLDLKDYLEESYAKVKEELKDKEPKMITILQIGDEPASNKYISNKVKRFHDVGIRVQIMKYKALSGDRFKNYDNGFVISKKGLITEFTSIDNAKFLQLPADNLNVPFIKSEYDVDGISLESKLRMYVENNPLYVPCTALGIYKYMKHLDNNLEGKSVLIINRSDLIGRPLSKILLDNTNMAVTMVHSHVPKEKILKLMKESDYVVSGIGIPHFFDKSEIPDGCTFIDCGIAFTKSGKMCGDLNVSKEDEVNFDYTPVPGGVGQLTTLSLVENIAYGKSIL